MISPISLTAPWQTVLLVVMTKSAQIIVATFSKISIADVEVKSLSISETPNLHNWQPKKLSTLPSIQLTGSSF